MYSSLAGLPVAVPNAMSRSLSPSTSPQLNASVLVELEEDQAMDSVPQAEALLE